MLSVQRLAFNVVCQNKITKDEKKLFGEFLLCDFFRHFFPSELLFKKVKKVHENSSDFFCNIFNVKRSYQNIIKYFCVPIAKKDFLNPS